MRLVEMAAIAAIMASLGAPNTAMAQQAMPKKVSCIVSAGSMGGQRFVTEKCHDVARPGHDVIRTTRWERDGAAEYNEAMRMAGKRFICDVGGTEGFSISGDMRTVYLKFQNCH